MKVFNGIILENGIVINIAEKQIPTVKDKKLQKIFDKYIELKNKYENLRSQEKLLAENTNKVSLISNLNQVCKCFQNLKLLKVSRLSLYNHNLMLQEIMKNFDKNINVRIDTKDPDYKGKKELFIYILKIYEAELTKYYKLIKKAEKEIRTISFQSEKTR